MTNIITFFLGSSNNINPLFTTLGVGWLCVFIYLLWQKGRLEKYMDRVTNVEFYYTVSSGGG